VPLYLGSMAFPFLDQLKEQRISLMEDMGDPDEDSVQLEKCLKLVNLAMVGRCRLKPVIASTE